MQLNFQERGRAALEVDQVFNESTVTGSFATSPMKLLTPQSRGHCVCTYVSNFGGGLVAGDQTRLDMRVGSHARCFLGTQASTKVYRNPQRLPCGHVTIANVQSDALLVFAPAPVQPFADSSYEQRQEFHLASGAGLALLDWFTSGRAACGERWNFSHFSSRNEVWRSTVQQDSVASSNSPVLKEEPLFLDACCLDATDGPLDSIHRTGRFNCFAVLVLLGAPLKRAVDQLLYEVRRLAAKRRSSLLMSASAIKEGAVLRVAGEQAAEVEHCLRHHLTPVADALGEDPWSRRL
jgi:urease accessory protein